MPGAGILQCIYDDAENKGEERETGNPSFTPAVVSAMEAAETVKLLLGKSSPLRNSLLTVDLLEHRYEIIDFGE